MLNFKSPEIQKYLFDRICQIHDEILMRDPEYRELGKLPSELMERLWAKLPPEEREWLDEYDSGRMRQMNRQDEIVYSRGLMDGIILCRWIDRIGRDVMLFVNR